MWTTFKTTVHRLLLTPSAVVWTLIFPIILATVFNFMFEPMRATTSIEAVDVAVVADDSWNASPFSAVVETLAEADEPLIALHAVASEQEARDLIEQGAVEGAYLVEAIDHGEKTALEKGNDADASTASAVTNEAAPAPHVILAPAGNGSADAISHDVNRSIIESIVTGYLQSEALIQQVTASNPAALADAEAVERALSLDAPVREISLTHARPDAMVTYYYALLDMASMFAAQLAEEHVWRLQPMASAEGARRAASGTSRMRQLVPTVGACWAVSSAFLAIAFGYIYLTAHIDFGGREALCLAGITAASLLSSGIGAVVGALPGKLERDSRSGLLTAATCLLSLFAGLYGAPAMQLADAVARAFPAAAWLNPVCLIRDMFYSVYYYDTLAPFTLRLLACCGIAVALLAGATWLLRRSAHEHR